MNQPTPTPVAQAARAALNGNGAMPQQEPRQVTLEQLEAELTLGALEEQRNAAQNDNARLMAKARSFEIQAAGFKKMAEDLCKSINGDFNIEVGKIMGSLGFTPESLGAQSVQASETKQ